MQFIIHDSLARDKTSGKNDYPLKSLAFSFTFSEVHRELAS